MKALALLACSALLAGCASDSPRRKPPATFVYHGGRPLERAFDALLERRANRAACERAMREFDGEPVRVTSRRQLLAARPPFPPTKRILARLTRWRKASYAPTIDDLRVIAFFDKNDRLVAYDTF